MGSLVSTAASLASIACNTVVCATTCASCCMNAAGSLSLRTAKIFYVLLLGLATLLALFFRYNGDDLGLDLGAWQVHCSSKDDKHSLMPGSSLAGYTLREDADYYIYCKGDAAVYRISAVLAGFFAIMTVLSFLDGGRTTRGWWAFKLFGLFFALLISFFVSNSFFDNSGYAWLARIGSVGFLLLQILILIDFSYDINDRMVELAFPAAGEENRFWLFAILGSAAVLYLVSLVGIPLLFTFFGECAPGVVFSSITLLGIIVFTGLTLFRDRIVGEEGAILPAAVVGAYSTYLAWSSLSSHPDPVCAPGHDTSSHHLANLIIGIIIATVSLMWTTLSVSDSIEGLVSGSDNMRNTEAATPLYTVESESGAESRVESGGLEHAEMDDSASTERIWIFHLVLMGASMYMGMLLTNWGASDNAHGNETGTIGLATMWVKIATQWLTMLLYIWTLVAPRVLGEYRDFDY
ncbi:Serine incorporator 3 [Hondaea fermentalgiana]|uniref:Serine incorporator 3 n=1 Tax=Hondaea fermentalgiana TaxID=2315210 RepID=A0A2R5G933_9STRA|nr:Serine incorporator 3 [Hondaea fermentalgiana]|eukprot:GBG24993.1 Serine incorporator 3 [Hondaea fermentalgiana]